MATTTSAKKAEKKQKAVGVPSEESKYRYREFSEKALDEMEALQPRKKTIVKDRRTAIRRERWPLSL